MVRIIIFWFLFCPGIFMFEQSKYKLIFERVEVVRYNKSYIDYAKTHNFKYNRTQTAVNVTFHSLVDLDGELSITHQAYKFASNEYRQFPLRFAVDLCRTLYNNDFGLHGLLECGNFTLCPLKKGWHHTCNFKPDEKRFPPLIPAGSYMIDLQFFHYFTEYIFLQGYGTIKYPDF